MTCSQKWKYQKYLSKTKVKRRKGKVVAVTVTAVSKRTLVEPLFYKQQWFFDENSTLCLNLRFWHFLSHFMHMYTPRAWCAQFTLCLSLLFRLQESICTTICRQAVSELSWEQQARWCPLFRLHLTKCSTWSSCWVKYQSSAYFHQPSHSQLWNSFIQT